MLKTGAYQLSAVRADFDSRDGLRYQCSNGLIEFVH